MLRCRSTNSILQNNFFTYQAIHAFQTDSISAKRTDFPFSINMASITYATELLFFFPRRFAELHHCDDPTHRVEDNNMSVLKT